MGQNLSRPSVKGNIWIRTGNAFFENERSLKTSRTVKRSTSIAQLKTLDIFFGFNEWYI